MDQDEDENSEDEWLPELQRTTNEQFHRQWCNKERRRSNLVCGLFLENSKIVKDVLRSYKKVV